MKDKPNGGVSPATLAQGFQKLPDDTPYAGENILHPEHVEEEKRQAKLADEYGWPEKDKQDGGFLGRPHEPWRNRRTEDRG